MITVQPLKRSEMQVCRHWTLQTSQLCLPLTQPSYAQDLGTGEVVHGLYGSLLQGLGTVLGLCGAVPCCPFPNPFREVQQGMFNLPAHMFFRFLILLQGSVGLVSRFGHFYKSVDPGLVQVNICTESLKVVDVKIQISPIGRQTVMYVPAVLFEFLIAKFSYQYEG